MQVQLSVFYKNAYISYQISSEDNEHYHFELKSAPQHVKDAPSSFDVFRMGSNWEIDSGLDPQFKNELNKTLKKIPKKS
jgi:hypothetical protein